MMLSEISVNVFAYFNEMSNTLQDIKYFSRHEKFQLGIRS